MEKKTRTKTPEKTTKSKVPYYKGIIKQLKKEVKRLTDENRQLKGQMKNQDRDPEVQMTDAEKREATRKKYAAIFSSPTNVMEEVMDGYEVEREDNLSSKKVKF